MWRQQTWFIGIFEIRSVDLDLEAISAKFGRKLFTEPHTSAFMSEDHQVFECYGQAYMLHTRASTVIRMALVKVNSCLHMACGR